MASLANTAPLIDSTGFEIRHLPSTRESTNNA